MIYLILALLCGSTFAIIFKIFQLKKVDTMLAITVNYGVSFLLGMIINFSGGEPINPLKATWLPMALVMGLMLMSAFVLMSISTRHSGVGVTTISARVALIVPVIGSYLVLPNQPEPSWFAILMILVALVLVFWSKEDDSKKINAKTILFPISVFLAFGMSNFFLKYSQYNISEKYASVTPTMQNELTTLTATIFFAAMAFSLLLYLLDKKREKKVKFKSIFGGTILGIINFFTVYLILTALGEVSAAIFFPIYNIGIVLIALFVGMVFFKEKLKITQIIGVCLAIIAIVLFFNT